MKTHKLTPKLQENMAVLSLCILPHLQEIVHFDFASALLLFTWEITNSVTTRIHLGFLKVESHQFRSPHFVPYKEGERVEVHLLFESGTYSHFCSKNVLIYLHTPLIFAGDSQRPPEYNTYTVRMSCVGSSTHSDPKQTSQANIV